MAQQRDKKDAGQRPEENACAAVVLRLISSEAMSLPDGFRYQTDFLSREEEFFLLQNINGLPFKEFVFQGFKGKRRVVSFGWRYDFNGGGLTKTEDMPGFLAYTRVKAERFAALFARQAATGPRHRIHGRRRHRLAQGPLRLRRCRRDIAPFPLHLSLSQKSRREVGAAQPYSGAAFYLPPARALPQ